MNLFRGVWGHMAPKAGLGLKSQVSQYDEAMSLSNIKHEVDKKRKLNMTKFSLIQMVCSRFIFNTEV